MDKQLVSDLIKMCKSECRFRKLTTGNIGLNLKNLIKKIIYKSIITFEVFI
jgi:hypothetical protein